MPLFQDYGLNLKMQATVMRGLDIESHVTSMLDFVAYSLIIFSVLYFNCFDRVLKRSVQT